jgi:indole-3-glycerol phosphate synthase
MATEELVPHLNVIIAAKRRYLIERKAKTPIEAVRALASMQKRPQPVLSSVADNSSVMLIGQIRYTLPQTGILGDTYDPVATALRYAHAGLDAAALFTDEVMYQRGLDDLVLVSRAVPLPIISQDYILDEYQVVETRAAGASALVLHSGVVDPPTLRALVSATHRNRMTAIVQVSDQHELDYALSLSPYVIGIRSRDAATHRLDMENALHLRRQIPSNMRVMFTDGLRSLDEVAAVAELGVHAVIVQESLTRTPAQLADLNAVLNRSNTPADLL